MKPEDRDRVAQLVQQIQSENDTTKLLPLMEELNQLLGDTDAEKVLLRASKSVAKE